MESGRRDHRRRTLRRLSLVIPTVAVVATGVSAVFALRNNNLTMLQLRDKVFTADEQGGDVNQSLSELQKYVATHMNTTLPKLGEERAIQLKYTYERLVAAENERVSAERQKIASDATAYCETSMPSGWLTNRAQCVADYVAARPVAGRPIAKELYSFDFVSPRWSPDLAGWLLVTAATSALILGIRLISGLLTHRSLRQHI